jgi:hypothetical protein
MEHSQRQLVWWGQEKPCWERDIMRQCWKVTAKGARCPDLVFHTTRDHLHKELKRKCGSLGVRWDVCSLWMLGGLLGAERCKWTGLGYGLLAKRGFTYSQDNLQGSTRETQGKGEVVTDVTGSGRVLMDKTLSRGQRILWIVAILDTHDRIRSRYNTKSG